MKIGIILYPYGEDKPGGLARTIFEWTKAMLEIDSQNEYVIFLKNKPKTPPELPGKNWRMETLGGGLFWKEKIKSFSGIDVHLFQTPVLPLLKPKNSIIITQDYPYKYIKPKNFKEWAKYKIIYFYHKTSLKRADMIIAVSKSSKEDTMKFFNISEKKIKIVYMGYKKICDVLESRVDLPENFFLFVGVVKERKNFFNIVKAFELFKKENSENNYKLVVAGKTGNDYYTMIKKYIDENNLTKDIIFLEYLNDSQLSYVYKRAKALVFPSIVESFGFPVLEAMSCGIPVITTKYQGPSEIVKDAGILVDPNNILEISQAISKLIKDENIKNNFIKKGYEKSKQFSWQKSAEDILRELRCLVDFR